MTAVTFGVIGHVDHGKTALVRALTGTDTDRLEEEKRRGLSIVLGFALLRTKQADIHLIDAPGHQDFIRAMISGATGVSGALVVVAANEGVRPQTIEHMEIAALLRIRSGVVALTKCDLVDGACEAARAAEARRLAETYGLENPAVIPVSTVSGRGVREIAATLERLAAGARPARENGFAFLPVDRAFVRPGVGPVVTGTLRRGRIAVGDRLEISPGGRTGVVRSVQIHGDDVRSAEPGARTALGLRGIGAGEIRRGMSLVTPGLIAPSQWLDVSVRAARSHCGPLRNGQRFRMFFGATEAEVRLRLLDADELDPGEERPAQLQARPEIAIPAHEPFILRLDSPAATVGGGVVLGALARRRRRHDPRQSAGLREAMSGRHLPLLMERIDAAGARGVRLADLARIGGATSARVARALRAAGAMPAEGDLLVSPETWARLRAACVARVEAHHESDPITPGLSRLALIKAFADSDPTVASAAVDDLVARGLLIEKGQSLAHPDFAAPAEAQALVGRIEAIFLAAGLAPPEETKVIAREPRCQQAIMYLLRTGRLVRASDRVQKRQFLFHRDVIENACRALVTRFSGAGGFSASEAGAALGISRKYSIPLLEHLDHTRFTQRRGDRRVITNRPVS